MKIRTNLFSGLTGAEIGQTLGNVAQGAGNMALGAAQAAGNLAWGAAKQAGALAVSAGEATLKVAAKPSFWLWPFA